MFIANYCPQTDMLPLLGGKFCGTKRMVGFMLFASGTTFAEDFDKEALDALVATGDVVGFLKPNTIEDNNSDPTYAESNVGDRSQTLAGRKGWRFVFVKSSCFQNELNKLNQSENWDFAPVLEDGSIVLRKTKAGTYAGFAAKTFVGLYNLPIMGGEDTGSVLEVDLLGSLNQWQNDAHILSATDFDFNEVNPIAGLNIYPTAPLTTTVVSTVKVKNLCSDVDVVGLTDISNWMIERNGVLEAPSGTITYDANNKTYSFSHTIFVVGDKISFVIMKNGVPIYVKDTSYYSGRSEIETVV